MTVQAYAATTLIINHKRTQKICDPDFFCVLLWLILYISLYFLYNINISGIGWLVGNRFCTIYITLKFQR